MQFIVHLTLNKISSNLTYNLGRRMLYFFDETLYLSGIGKSYHYLYENFKGEDFNFKLVHLIRQAEGESKDELENFSKVYKEFLRSKNKSSKAISQMNIAKKYVEKMFEESITHHANLFEKVTGVSTFRDLFDDGKIQFYEVDDPNNYLLPEELIAVEDILSLKVANEEFDIPILFLGNEDNYGNVLLNLDLENVQNKEYGKGYLVDTLQFPYLADVQAAEMKAITHHFSKEIQSLKDKLSQWAKISFNNPNTKEAQQFFIKNVVPIVEEKKGSFFQLDAAQDVNNRHSSKFTFHLQFGELPIETIWELYKVYNHITEEQHQNLLKIKKENPTKYTGRWPVAFFKTDCKEIYQKLESPQEMPKNRKTLDID